MTPRRQLVALVGADLLSNLGSRISVVAIPWLVLETTGSPVKMGVVAAAETLPYLLSSALGTPLADRLGLRRSSILADVGSAGLMVAVALTPWLGFGTLVALVAVVGALRGVGDRVKHVLFRPVAEAAGVRLIRLTSVYDGLGRVVTLIGAGMGGLLIWWFGVTWAILIDAATFAVCAALIGLLVRAPAAAGDGAPAAPQGYLRALGGGFRYLGRDHPLLTMLLVISALNMVVNASIAVYIPLWVADVLGNPAGLGLVLGAFSAGALLGNVLFTVLGPRLRRDLTFAVGAAVSGAPRLLVLALSEDLPLVLVVTFLSGIGIAVVNPLLGVALYERVPAELQTRVIGLAGSLAFAGLPVGALLGGWTVTAYGLVPALLAAAVFALLVTTIPLLTALRSQPAPTPDPSPVPPG
ncbi:MFS transporter [Micromonospora endolithica]|uniref:MFS transporter n=1 Tax=Micromonospora endolithica TaxID=230091 RepID=A0A3A9YX56_9ACTN|nr:MFS transporter [Micromonospora endolithica]RKN40613.1 MFS transporter [Micromonospora endolithica]TWJ21696.1 putative MFS family arabinose efflux permease [Micromonospora endolithica]